MQHIQKAIETFTRGGIVIFPTDTAFGIGCRIDNEQSVSKLFEIRRRSITKPTPVLVSSVSMAEKWVDEIPEKARELMEKYWPGGLTLIVPSTGGTIPELVKGGTDTLGIRMPAHDELLQIIEKVRMPIIGSSANFEGGQTPYTVNDLDPELIRLVDFVLPGECKTKQASTVLDCTVEPYKIIREGAVELPGIRNYEQIIY